MADVSGIIASIDAVVAAITRDPVGAFLPALDIGTFPIYRTAMANGLIRPQVDAENSKIMWAEGASGSTNVYLATAITSNSETTFDFGTTAINAVVVNNLIAFNTELVRVTSVDYEAGTCVVTRNVASSGALSSILTTDIGYILSATPTESEDAGTATGTVSVPKTNYLHYWEEVVKITDKAQGQTSQMRTPETDVAYQVTDKFKKIGRQMAQALWLSRALSTGNYRTMAGFRAQVATHVYNSIGALEFSDLNTAVKDIVTGSGIVPKKLYVGADLKGGLSQWANGVIKTVVNSDPSSGGGSLMTYETSSGIVLEVELDTSLLPTDAFICDPANLHAGFVPILPQVNPSPDLPQMTGLRVERLGRAGAYNNIQILAYATSQLARESGSALLTGVTSVDSDGKA